MFVSYWVSEINRSQIKLNTVLISDAKTVKITELSIQYAILDLSLCSYFIRICTIYKPLPAVV